MHALSDADFNRFSSDAVSLGIMSRGANARSWNKADGTTVSGLDLNVDVYLGAIAAARWPHIPVVSEESWQPGHKFPDGDYFCYDPVDGSAYRREGKPEWSHSKAQVCDGRPVLGVVVQPVLQRTFRARVGRGVEEYLRGYERNGWVPFNRPETVTLRIGTDFSDVSPVKYQDEVIRVMEDFGLKSAGIVNMPAVHSGIEVLQRRILCCWSYTWHIWDVAALYVLLREAGAYIGCLDGSPTPWGGCWGGIKNRVDMPPMIMADNERTAERVLETLARAG